MATGFDDSKIDKSGGQNACWPWIGARVGTGYGAFKKGTTTCYAHRESYIKSHGSIPKGKWVLHTCDNRICVNPRHLYAGTVKENVRDMWRRGRQVIPRLTGEKHPSSKLTKAEVEAMRWVRESHRLPFRVLGRMFGISKASARSACIGESWASV